MTSPITRITVECPACRRSYESWYRASFNLEVDPQFTDDYIEKMTTGTCPACGHRVALGGLVVRRDGVWEMRRAE